MLNINIGHANGPLDDCFLSHMKNVLFCLIEIIFGWLKNAAGYHRGPVMPLSADAASLCSLEMSTFVRAQTFWKKVVASFSLEESGAEAPEK